MTTTPDPTTTDDTQAPVAAEEVLAVEPTTPVDEAATPLAAEPEVVVEPDAEPAVEVEAEAEAEAAAEPEQTEVEPAAEPVVEAETEAAAEPAVEIVAPAAAPAPKPIPRPVPRPRLPQAPRPAAAGATPVAAVVAPPLEEAEIRAASAFGSVAEDGTVTVRDGEAERVVGQVPGAQEVEALSLYVRRYLDLKAQVGLLEARLDTLNPKEVTSTLTSLTEQLVEPAAVGDLPALRTRLEALAVLAQERAAEATAARDAARAQAIVERTALVDEVEAIAATDPSRIQWRDATARLATLLEEWKSAQRGGVRIDRPTEDALWKRFSHARTSFDKNRRAHFSDLDKRNAEARGVKEGLVIKAEALAGSSDWGPVGSQLRALMDEWRVAPRGNRKDDEALWVRFKAAQDAFYGARSEVNAAIDSEYEANLAVKLELLTKAEALLPIKDLNATKRELRNLQDAWDEAGKVPRADIQRTEARLRAVEQAVRDAEAAELTRTNPEVKARVEGAAAQLLDSIAALEAELAAAEAAGNTKKAKDAAAALATRRQWLDVVQKSQS